MHIMAQQNAFNWSTNSDAPLMISWFRDLEDRGRIAEFSKRKFMPTWRHLGLLVRRLCTSSVMFGCVTGDVQWVFMKKFLRFLDDCFNFFQSQPCHWRNLKGVTKREVPADPANSTLSDNISLFQSIRVLQDEDEPTAREQSALRKQIKFFLHQIFDDFFIFTGKDPTETCVKTSVLSALSATCAMLLSILVGSLFVACTKLRHRKNENPFFDSAYVGHKGQID